MQPEYIKWIVYIQGSENLLDIERKLDFALSWINRAELIMNSTTEWNEQFNVRDYVKGHLYWTKGRLLANDNNFLEAKEYVQKLIDLENTIFYEKNNLEGEIEASLNLWNEY